METSTIKLDHIHAYDQKLGIDVSSASFNRIAKIEIVKGQERNENITEHNVIYYDTYTGEIRIGDGKRYYKDIPAVNMSLKQEIEIRELIKSLRGDLDRKTDQIDNYIDTEIERLKLYMHIFIAIAIIEFGAVVVTLCKFLGLW